MLEREVVLEKLKSANSQKMGFQQNGKMSKT